MLLESLAVAPRAAVVNNDRVGNFIFGVVDASGTIRIENANHVAVGDDCVFFLVDGDRSIELTVNRIPPQQARAFEQAIILAFLYDDGAQSPFVPAPTAFNENPRYHAANPAETVEHDVLGAVAHRT
mgnify:CR=1 FL=1